MDRDENTVYLRAQDRSGDDPFSRANGCQVLNFSTDYPAAAAAAFGPSKGSPVDDPDGPEIKKPR